MKKNAWVFVFAATILLTGCLGGQVVPDNPVITLLGDSVVFVEIGAGYVEPGFTAVDDDGLDISNTVLVGGDVVDDQKYGIYVVTYNVVDGQGLEAQEKRRTVRVVSHFDDFSDWEATADDWDQTPPGSWAAFLEDGTTVLRPGNIAGTARIDWKLQNALNRNQSNFAFGVRFKNAPVGQIQPQRNWAAGARYDVAWDAAANSITFRSRWWDGAKFDLEVLGTATNVGVTSGWHEIVVEFIGERMNIYWDNLDTPVWSIDDDRHMADIIMTVALWQQTISVDYAWLAFFDVD